MPLGVCAHCETAFVFDGDPSTAAAECPRCGRNLQLTSLRKLEETPGRWGERQESAVREAGRGPAPGEIPGSRAVEEASRASERRARPTEQFRLDRALPRLAVGAEIRSGPDRRF